jgi:hypothetical protein
MDVKDLIKNIREDIEKNEKQTQKKIIKKKLSRAEIWLLLSACIFIVGILIFVGIEFSHYGNQYDHEIPKHTVKDYDIEQIFATASPSDQKVKLPILKINSFLQDTLSDQEEGDVLVIIEECKRDTTLNGLINKLDDSGLLKILVKRWEEEALNYEKPNLLDKFLVFFTGDSLLERPPNVNYENTFFDKVFTYKYLDKEAGRKVLSAFNYRFGYGDFNSPKNTNIGLQIYITILVSENGIRHLSSSTLELSKEVLKYYKGTPSHNSTINLCRMSLGMKEY